MNLNFIIFQLGGESINPSGENIEMYLLDCSHDPPGVLRQVSQVN